MKVIDPRVRRKPELGLERAIRTEYIGHSVLRKPGSSRRDNNTVAALRYIRLTQIVASHSVGSPFGDGNKKIESKDAGPALIRTLLPVVATFLLVITALLIACLGSAKVLLLRAGPQRSRPMTFREAYLVAARAAAIAGCVGFACAAGTVTLFQLNDPIVLAAIACAGGIPTWLSIHTSALLEVRGWRMSTRRKHLQDISFKVFWWMFGMTLVPAAIIAAVYKFLIR